MGGGTGSTLMVGSGGGGGGVYLEGVRDAERAADAVVKAEVEVEEKRGGAEVGNKTGE